MIARYAYERELKTWSPSTPLMRSLKKLSRERQRLINNISSVNNHRHAETNSGKPKASILTRLQRQIAFLETQLKEVDEEINELCAQDEELGKMVVRLNTIFGINTISSITILAETDGFRLFTKRSQLIKYAGYDVVEKQSGTSVNGKTRISKKGNSRIRKALHFPAMTAIRQEGIFLDVYNRVFERTKCKMQALVAVQRKLLITMYAMTKNEMDYQINYHKKRKETA
ncbi:MAG: transposase [Neolewinella sp.]|jgi:transposase